mgnify:CR=1 FL=1
MSKHNIPVSAVQLEAMVHSGETTLDAAMHQIAVKKLKVKSLHETQEFQIW